MEDPLHFNLRVGATISWEVGDRVEFIRGKNDCFFQLHG